jgi:hypothetical protein
VSTTAPTNRELGRARRAGTIHAIQQRDRGLLKLGDVTTGDVFEQVFYRKPKAPDEWAAATKLHASFTTSADTRWKRIGECDHDFTGKTPRSWGMSDGARCRHCKVSVESGMTSLF